MAVKSQIIGITKLQDLATKLNAFEYEVRKFAEIKLNQPSYRNLLEAFNIENLEQGIRPDGTQIEKTPVKNQQSNKYERYTEYLKQKRGQNPNTVNLRDTGSFHNSIVVRIGFDAIYFISRDPKSETLENIWGLILGITEQQLFEFIDLITPEFQKFAIKYFKNEGV